jgi:hypothetical protein
MSSLNEHNSSGVVDDLSSMNLSFFDDGCGFLVSWKRKGID